MFTVLQLFQVRFTKCVSVHSTTFSCLRSFSCFPTYLSRSTRFKLALPMYFLQHHFCSLPCFFACFLAYLFSTCVSSKVYQLICFPLRFLACFLLSLFPVYLHWIVCRSYSCFKLRFPIDVFSTASLSWPSGNYGLPMPVSGCPRSNFTWKTGWRFQDTEDKDPRNGRSPVLHVEGLVRDSSVNRSFCMKTSGAGNADATRWPKGRNPVLNALLLKVERS